MQTNFTLAQLADPNINEADKILRVCVHCGFCTATCPTYVLLGDELDSPRGRIYLIKDMLEGGKAATAKIVKHIDRCLSWTTPACISRRPTDGLSSTVSCAPFSRACCRTRAACAPPSLPRRLPSR